LIFKKLFFDKKFKSIDNRIQEDELKYKLIPVEAKAGSLIVFDSDTFHRGGIIKKDNLERLIIRLHCYKT
jgi:ectoine hydroxylase-related dioxygenase (phytanoyl-CoA dioxygenase family)